MKRTSQKNDIQLATNSPLYPTHVSIPLGPQNRCRRHRSSPDDPDGVRSWEDSPATDLISIPMGRHAYSPRFAILQDSEEETEAETNSEAEEIDSDVLSSSNSSEGDDVNTWHYNLRVPKSSINSVSIDKTEFQSVLKEVKKMLKIEKFRIAKEAENLLQIESEKFVTNLFKAAQSVAGEREKLRATDIYAALQIDDIMKKSAI